MMDFLQNNFEALLPKLVSPGFIVLYIFIAAGIFVHFRGKVKHKFFRQLTDHSTVMGPVNVLMYLFSPLPGKPYLPLEKFPQLKLFRDNWQIIREEAMGLMNEEKIKGSDKYDDIGFNSFFRRGWKRFYLKWYKSFHSSALDSCPKTVELIKQVPGIKAAMFTFLPAGSKLVKHRDPYAGSLRYHLGLITPNDAKCQIIVDGEPYYWKDGEDVLFDETYIHYAINETDKDRLIFFCDVEKPVYFPFNYVNKFFGWLVMAAAASPNEQQDKTGGINKAFQYIYQIRLVGKKLKAYNKNLYYLVKYILFIGILYLIFF